MSLAGRIVVQCRWSFQLLLFWLYTTFAKSSSIALWYFVIKREPCNVIQLRVLEYQRNRDAVIPECSQTSLCGENSHWNSVLTSCNIQYLVTSCRLILLHHSIHPDWTFTLITWLSEKQRSPMKAENWILILLNTFTSTFKEEEQKYIVKQIQAFPTHPTD